LNHGQRDAINSKPAFPELPANLTYRRDGPTNAIDPEPTLRVHSITLSVRTIALITPADGFSQAFCVSGAIFRSTKREKVREIGDAQAGIGLAHAFDGLFRLLKPPGLIPHDPL
jgi:hypothetical protein